MRLILCHYHHHHHRSRHGSIFRWLSVSSINKKSSILSYSYSSSVPSSIPYHINYPLLFFCLSGFPFVFFFVFFFFTSMPESFYYVRTQLCYRFFFFFVLFSSVVALSCCYPGQSSRMLCRFAIHIFYSEWKILLTYFIFIVEIFHLGSALLDEWRYHVGQFSFEKSSNFHLIWSITLQKPRVVEIHLITRYLVPLPQLAIIFNDTSNILGRTLPLKDLWTQDPTIHWSDEKLRCEKVRMSVDSIK